MEQTNNDNVEVLDLNIHEELVEKKEKSNNKNSQKTYIIVFLSIIIFGLIGYYFYLINSGKDDYLEKKMEVASKDYYEKYISTNDSTSAYIVTLNMLINANNNGENYDLKGLEKCKPQSTLAIITVNYKNGDPKKVEVELNC